MLFAEFEIHVSPCEPRPIGVKRSNSSLNGKRRLRADSAPPFPTEIGHAMTFTAAQPGVSNGVQQSQKASRGGNDECGRHSVSGGAAARGGDRRRAPLFRDPATGRAREQCCAELRQYQRASGAAACLAPKMVGNRLRGFDHATSRRRRHLPGEIRLRPRARGRRRRGRRRRHRRHPDRGSRHRGAAVGARPHRRHRARCRQGGRNHAEKRGG